jgi:hypothetical protein
MQSTASLYPSQYREYYRDWKDAYAKKPEIFHDSGFEWLAKHAKKVGGSHKVVDGKIMRVFFPIYIEPTVPRNMQLVFSANGYQVVSDKEVVDTHNRQVSINKAFQQLAKKSGLDANVIKKNLDSYAEELGASGAMILVVSRHPYDIVGMSTGRAWKSCHTVGGMSPRDKKADEIARRKFYEKHEALRKAAEAEAAESDEYVEAKKNLAAVKERSEQAYLALSSTKKSFVEDLERKSAKSLRKDMESIKVAAKGKEREVMTAILSFFAKFLVRESIESEPAFAVPSWARPGAVGEDTRRKLLFDGDDSFCGGEHGFAQGRAELITESSRPSLLDLSRQEMPDFNSDDFADAIYGLYISSNRRKLAARIEISRDHLSQLFPQKRTVVFIPALIDFVCPEPSAVRNLLRKASPLGLWKAIESTLRISRLSLNEVVDQQVEHVVGLAAALRATEAALMKADKRSMRSREKNPAQHAWEEKVKVYENQANDYRTGVYSHLVRQDVITGSVIAYVIKPKMSLLTSLERAGKLLPKFAEALESRLDKGNKDPIFEPLGRVIFRTAHSWKGDVKQSKIAYLRAGNVYGFGEKLEISEQFKRMAKHLVVTLNKSARRDMSGLSIIPRALHRGDHDTTYAEGDLYGSPRLNYHED